MVDFHGYTILFLIWLLSIIVVRSIFVKTGTTTRLPPSPLALPIIGHLHLLVPIPHQALHKLSTRLGPIIQLYLGSKPCIVVSSAQLAKEFLQTHESSFSNRPKLSALDFLTYGSADFSFAPYGPYWKFMKKLCMSELLGGRILEQFYPIRQEEIVGFVQLMQTKAEKGEKTDVGEELIKLANNVISRMTMSQSCTESEDEARHVSKLVREIAELTGRFNLSDYFGFCKNLDLQGFRKRLKEVRDRFDEMIEKVIREHQEGRRKRKEQDSDGAERVEDILDVLLDIEADEKAEMKLSRENIKAFILDIFSAGTDTSAITTEWALAELINHPDQMRKARAEIDSIVGKTKLVQESDIPSLPYLQAIIKETLRLHPAGPIIIRESTQACTVAGYQIPAQTRLFVNVWSLNRDPTYWVDPLEFRPERFMDSEYGSGKSNLDVRGQHFQLLPFGSGRRGCPGISLALQVVQTSLAAMVQCFEWKVDGGSVDMEEGPGLTLPRAHPLVSTPIPRLNPFPSI